MDERTLNRKAALQADKESGAPLLLCLVPLLLLTSIFFMNFLSRVVLGPLLPTIEEHLQIGHGEAGSLFLAISIGYFVAVSASGFVSAALNHRQTIIISCVALGAAMIVVSLCPSLVIMRFGLVLVGVGAGLYIPSAIATITALVRPDQWGKALAIHEQAPIVGLIVMPLLVEILLTWYSWRRILAFVGVSCILSGMAFTWLGRGGGFSGEAPRASSVRMLARDPSFWIMVFFFSIGIGASLGVYTMLPLFLVNATGMDSGRANTLVALSRISCVFMSFAAGWLTDRIGPKRSLSIVFSCTGVMTVLLGFSSDWWIVASVFIQPALAVCFFPPGFAALSGLGPPSVRNVAVSLTLPVAYLLGAGGVPAVIGFFGEAGSFALGIASVGVLTFIGALLTPLLKLRSRTKT